MGTAQEHDLQDKQIKLPVADCKINIIQWNKSINFRKISRFCFINAKLDPTGKNILFCHSKHLFVLKDPDCGFIETSNKSSAIIIIYA